MTFLQLQAELRKRQRSVGTLIRRRDRLAQRIADLDERIRSMGGGLGGGGPGGGRARNERSLPEALHALLQGRTMRVTDAAEAVQEAGYRTNSRTFRVQVNIALVKRKDLFKRVGRGQYTAK
jgi:hypothetical protein